MKNIDLIRALVSIPPVNIVAAEPEQMPDEKGAFLNRKKVVLCKKRDGVHLGKSFKNLVPELVFAGYADGNPHYDKMKMHFMYRGRLICCVKNME